MSMTSRTCCHCGSTYEWYQVANTVPNCPRCGADAVTHRPMTADEFYKGVGVPKGGPVQYGRTNARMPR